MTEQERRNIGLAAAVAVPAIGLAALLWPRKAAASPSPAPAAPEAGLAANLPAIVAAADRWGIPRNLLVGLIHYETAGTFDPRSEHPTDSRAIWSRYRRDNPHLVGGRRFAQHGEAGNPEAWGSKGLGQLILATALVEGYPFTAPYTGLFDAATSVFLAAKRLRRLLDRHGGDLRDALAAYNSGLPLGRAPAVTRDRYVPGVMRLADRYRTDRRIT